MPRPLSEYDLTDWVHLRPLQHRVKSWRYALVRERYMRRRSAGLDIVAIRRAVAGRRLLVTVAFDDPEILGWQVRAIRRCVGDAVHLVADNSRNADNAAEIAALCNGRKVLHIRLPDNPWSRRAPSRSHGLALNWIWRNVVVPAGPPMVGFLDHDLIPLEPCDPFEPLQRQNVHGDKRWVGSRWFLWAGYCFFRPDQLRGLAIDFGQDWFVGLDTGGGNWGSIYAHLDPATLDERPIEAQAILPGVPLRQCYVERRGTWLHEVGLAQHSSLKAPKRAAFLRLLDPADADPTAAR